MSRYPDRDFVWKGPIHCTSDIGINGDKNLAHAKYPFGNNHGGLVEINGQWYIFDHRMTNGSIFARQGVAEPVEIYENGTIRMVEATSQGLYGKAAGAWVTQDGPDYEPADPKNPGKDPWPAPQSFVHVQKKTVLIGYKYFDLEKNSEITLRSRGKGSGEIEILTDPEGPVLASVPIRPSADWADGSVALTLPSVGKTALFFRCMVKGGCDLLEFTLQ